MEYKLGLLSVVTGVSTGETGGEMEEGEGDETGVMYLPYHFL